MNIINILIIIIIILNNVTKIKKYLHETFQQYFH